LEHFIWFVVVISIVVFVHEFGHFCVARIYGIEVQKFSIGFGPALFKFVDKKGTQWILSMVPMGGYVKLYGDDADPSFVDSEKMLNISEEERNKSFYCKPSRQQALVIAAGPFANYLLSFLCFFIVFMMVGIPKLDSRIATVQESSVASVIGLRSNDIIIKIDDQLIEDGTDIKKVLNSGEEEVSLKFLRNNEEFSVNFKLPFDESGARALGITLTPKIEKASVFESLKFSFQHIYLMSKMMLFGIFDIITGKIGIEQISGPIKIAEYSSKAAAQSLDSFIWFIALISLNLGLVNLLPIPMLDGGRLFFYFIEAITNNPIKKNTKIIALKLGLFILVTLMLVALFNDVVSLL